MEVPNDPDNPLLRRNPQGEDHNDGNPTLDNGNHQEDMQQRAPTISWLKLLLVGALGGFALFLQVTVWTLEVLVEERREHVLHVRSKMDDNQADVAADNELDAGTINPMTWMKKRQLFMHQLQTSVGTPSTGSSRVTQSHAYWKTALRHWWAHWDPIALSHLLPQSSGFSSWATTDPITLMLNAPPSFSASSNNYMNGAPPTSSSSPSGSSSFSLASSSSTFSSTEEYPIHQFPTSSLASPNTTLAWFAMQEAAQLGHVEAQFYSAFGLVSGLTSSSDDLENPMIPTKRREREFQARLYWHMAAMHGHVDAALAMAAQLEYETHTLPPGITQLGGSSTTAPAKAGQTPSPASKNKKDISSGSSSSGMTANTCRKIMPYYKAAATNIIDSLETDWNSRSKVGPAVEKHILYQIHLHGGTASKLEYHNRPDETPDALQFYHIKAMAYRGGTASGNSAATTSSADDGRREELVAAASAAFTLANFYQYGFRGVTQNLTMALEYYERAAQLEHWEAAGQAGKFWLHGIGVRPRTSKTTSSSTQKPRSAEAPPVPPDPYKAHKYFVMGMPLGLKGCQRRYDRNIRAEQRKAARKKATSDDDDTEEIEVLSNCDPSCLNGMGLLHVFGVPHILKVDVGVAKEFFSLAKDMGNMDAAYNLAMLKMGWQHSWELLPKDDSKGQSLLNQADVFPGGSKSPKQMPTNSLTVAEYQSILTDLSMAANKGHMQARLRLGLMYASGVQVPGGSGSVAPTVAAVPNDCTKALKHFKYIAEHASPTRNRRLRTAYKQYVAGNFDAALLNYWVAAETGSVVGVLNSAFLLEQGICLHLDSVACAKAAVRLWKRAAVLTQKTTTTIGGVGGGAASIVTSTGTGHVEAYLRVGDFYYYGKLRRQGREAANSVAPFGWVRYLLFPEDLAVLAWNTFQRFWEEQTSPVEKHVEISGMEVPTPSTCTAGEVGSSDIPGECPVDAKSATSEANKHDDDDDEEHTLESDLEMAAHYYRQAAETNESPRAHFNLGFLYEWGLGLKQDFPLAKRHYDLAVAGTGSSEAELPVAIALIAMNIHERIVKIYTALKEEMNGRGVMEIVDGLISSSSTQEPQPKLLSAGEPPVGKSRGKARMEIIWKHVWSWESLVILLLSILVSILLQLRRTRRP